MAWEYIRVVAPEDYPGSTYNSGLVLEHHLVWWQNTGEMVPPGHCIHHKDDNKVNNSFSNLELMRVEDHSRMHSTTGKTMVVLECPICKAVFEREKRQTHLVKKGNDSTCCSRSCAAVKSNRK